MTSVKLVNIIKDEVGERLEESREYIHFKKNIVKNEKRQTTKKHNHSRTV